MNVGESQEYLAQFKQDLAAEPDPDLRAWYKQEFELQPDFIVATQTKEALGTMATQLTQLAELKSQVPEAAEANGECELIEEVVEQPRIPTKEELTRKQVERKYQTYREQYDTEINTITKTVKKASKRTHQERMAKRQFIRNFVDFTDVTGNEHILLDPELLSWSAAELFKGEDDLVVELFSNSAEYAEKHGAEVTADPKNFANIVSQSVKGMPFASEFNSIIRSIFSNRHNTPDFAEIYSNLADMVYELLDTQTALDKVAEILNPKNKYLTNFFHVQLFKAITRAAMVRDSDADLDIAESNAVFSHLVNDILALEDNTLMMDLSKEDVLKAVHSVAAEFNLTPREAEDRFLNEANSFRAMLGATTNYDPVEVTSLASGEAVDLKTSTMSDEIKDILSRSSKFQKRMQHLAPYAYAIEAARKVLGGGIHSILVPLSPSVSVEAFIPIGSAPYPSDSKLQQMQAQLAENFYGILAIAIEHQEAGIQPYQKTGMLSMKYEPLYGDDVKKGVIIYRPHISLDRRTHPPLQFLTVNYTKIKAAEDEPKSKDFYEEYNSLLRSEIQTRQKRFLGRRPIKFSMPDDLKGSGLNAVSLRYDAKSGTVKAEFQLYDGDIEVELDKELNIAVEEPGEALRSRQVTLNPHRNHNLEVLNSGKAEEPNKAIRLYYENLILRLVEAWSCSNEVQTSEGLISEETGNAANMGHFAYLPIRDGKKYKYSETQRDRCKEEQGLDLATESQRLRLQDPTGQVRNSTYVRENYDPNKPPLEVYLQF